MSEIQVDEAPEEAVEEVVLAEEPAVVTDEAVEEAAVDEEAARRKEIRRGFAENAAAKEDCKREVNAGRRDPRAVEEAEEE